MSRVNDPEYHARSRAECAPVVCALLPGDPDAAPPTCISDRSIATIKDPIAASVPSPSKGSPKELGKFLGEHTELLLLNIYSDRRRFQAILVLDLHSILTRASIRFN